MALHELGPTLFAQSNLSARSGAGCTSSTRPGDHGNGGINIAKALGIAVATGAGVVLTLVVIAMQLD